MKRVISFLLAAALVLASAPVMSIAVDAAAYGDLHYSVSNGTVTITGCETSATGDLIIPSTLDGYPVTGISRNAFYECSGLTSVTIPNGVTTIGTYAFRYCENMTSVTIPDSVTSIGDYAFAECSNLAVVTIPDNVTTIAAGLFQNCASLTGIKIPDKVTSIGAYAFARCSNLAVVKIPDSVTNIDYDAFKYCERLISVTIPNSVTNIGDNAFRNCSSLTSVTIGNGVTSIGQEAFYNCDSLTDVYYAGTQAQWDAINIEYSYWDDGLKYAQKHYSHIHDYSLIPPVEVAPTCTQAGYTQYTCAYGETHEEYTKPAVGHDYSVRGKVVPATCTAQGYTVMNCSRCTAVQNTNYTNALGHNNTEVVEVISPTCTAQGYTNTKCSRCSAIIKTDYVDALGHSMIALPGKDPTCTVQGQTVGTGCERCGLIGVAQTAIPATGHSFTDGACTVCGVEDYWSYTINENEVTITAYVGPGGEVKIPAHIENVPVVAIGTSAFYECTNLSSITIPISITSIGDSAFLGCTSLTVVYYQGTVNTKADIEIDVNNDALIAANWHCIEAVALHKQDDVETYYKTMEEALAVTDGTIQLLADVTADVVNLNANVTLDLNGYTLTAGSASGKVMDSQDGKGLIKVSAQSAVLSSNEDQLILWDNATENPGYRVFNYTFTNMGLDAHKDDESESAKAGMTVKSVWSDLVFTNSYAYTLAASTYSGLQVGFELSWTPDGGEKASKTFNFNAATLGAWGAAEEGSTGAENYCFYIRVTGFEELLNSGTVTVKPVVSTAFNAAETAVTEMRYEYAEPNPGGLEYKVGFGIVPEI